MAKKMNREVTAKDMAAPSEYGGKPKKDVQIGGSAGNALHDMYTSDPGRPPRGRR